MLLCYSRVKDEKHICAAVPRWFMESLTEWRILIIFIFFYLLWLVVATRCDDAQLERTLHMNKWLDEWMSASLRLLPVHNQHRRWLAALQTVGTSTIFFTHHEETCFVFLPRDIAQWEHSPLGNLFLLPFQIYCLSFVQTCNGNPAIKIEENYRRWRWGGRGRGGGFEVGRLSHCEKVTPRSIKIKMPSWNRKKERIKLTNQNCFLVVAF